MKVSLIPAAIVSFVLMGQFLHSCACGEGGTDDIQTEKKDTVYPLGFCTDSFEVTTGSVRNGENFSALLFRLGLDSRDAHNLVQNSDSIFDVRKFRAGNNWTAYSDSSRYRYLVYEQDRINLIVFSLTDSLYAYKVRREVRVERKAADITIDASLWVDMTNAGVSPVVIADLSDIYAWTVDFFSLRKGDRFSILYDLTLCEGEPIGCAGIPYAVFRRDTSVYQAIMFDQGDNGNRYWNEKGQSMRKAFLKAPLKFTRISSGFSYHRRHPVHGTVRAHTGVDYAAPTGTPVMSIGDGTVISKGWNGGGGNTVKVRHNSVYTTAYLHLSKYAKGLKVGDRVHQGQVIGYVGMTGTATGPHLDFRVWKNGTPINPLKMESPSVEPIDPSNMAGLDSVRVVYSAMLDSLIVNN